MRENKKKIFLKNFGCQMNVRDSEVICGLLRAANCELTDRPEKAEVIIFNTCSVRQHAEDRVWSEVGRFKKAGIVPIIGIVGCMAKNYQERIFERAAQVDFVVGPSDIHKIPSIIFSLLESQRRPLKSGGSPYLLERKIWETDGLMRPEAIYHTGFYEDKSHAFVVISEGCSNYCSYCVVPHVRGELHNRHHEDILKEIKEAVDGGITKVTLLGQNVNAYKTQDARGKTQLDFIRLLGEVNRIGGLKEFSFITSHPKDTSLALFQAMQGCDRLKKYLHLPVQSGSDKILKLMNRGYARKTYVDLIENYRKIVKGGTLTTDIIVGFPGESEEDFQDTYDLVNDVQFNAAFIFKYSPRPHTAAEKFADNVERKEKERRHRLVLELQKAISRRK